MDTNLKSTNTFKGLLSWACLLLVLCACCLAAVFAALVLVNPGMLEYAAGSVQDFAATVPPSLQEHYNRPLGARALCMNTG